MAGYECTDKLNCFGNRVDFYEVTRHLEKIDEDYRLLSNFNIHTVREGIRWNKAEPSPYHYDFSDVRIMVEAGKRHGIQQLWDLCHFGFPDDLTPLHPMFARRFASLCREFAKFYRSIDPSGALVVTPFNEVSFLSWLGGEVNGTSPYCRGYGWEVKYHLMKAYIEGIEALKEIDNGVRIMVTEPLVNIVPDAEATPEIIEEAAKKHEDQYQVLDILTGRMCPELRGREEYLDIVGCNYYYDNQWEVQSCKRLAWANDGGDIRFRPLSNLMRELFERYNRPIVLSETSYPGIDRPKWVLSITEECCKALQQGIPLWGICWYPIIDRPDWDHLQPWHRSGIWDIDDSDITAPRILHQPTAAALTEAQLQIRTYIQHKPQGSAHLLQVF